MYKYIIASILKVPSLVLDLFNVQKSKNGRFKAIIFSRIVDINQAFFCIAGN